MYKGKFLWLAALALLLVVFACGKKDETTSTPAPATSAPTGGAGGGEYSADLGTASVTGKVTFQGQAPAGTKIQMGADPVCQTHHKTGVVSEEVVVNDGKLQNVFVYVKEGADKWTYKAPSDPVVLDQEGCMYKPHVLGIQVDQTLNIKNSDPALHNVHPYAKVNAPWNIGMPTKGMVIPKKFSKPEVMIPVRCDVHKWMTSYIGVLPHPFHSVTGPDGSFTLKGLPAGAYVIEAWHEKFGSKTENVTVGDKETKEITFAFQS